MEWKTFVDSPGSSADALLTPRQLNVLELVAKGLTNPEIANVLGIARGTVKVHVAAVIEALDVTNRTEAATRLHELGLASQSFATPEAFHVDGFGSRPAIAVLPFDSFSSDPEHALFADGFVEDLITRLAGWRWFPVIARNSTLAYKGRATDMKEVARALGAGYLVEGSVRRTGDRLRITVQVIDGATNVHVWANRYECALDEIFDVSDSIVDSIVATLQPALVKIGGLKLKKHKPDDLDAWQTCERAWSEATGHTPDGYRRAQELLDRVLGVDPGFAVAHQMTLSCQFNVWQLGSVEEAAEALGRINASAQSLTDGDPNDPWAHFANAIASLFEGDRNTALSTIDRAIELQPSLAWAISSRGMILNALGRSEEALVEHDRAIRLSPYDPIRGMFSAGRAGSLSVMGRFEESEATLRSVLGEMPGLPYAHAVLIPILVGFGRADEARALADRMHEIAPDYSPQRSVRAMLAPEARKLVLAMWALLGIEDDGSGPRV